MKVKRSRVILLVHPAYRPDRRGAAPGTERDIYQTLRKRGHTVEVVPLRDDLTVLQEAVERFRPDVVFNLLEEFRDEGVFDFHAVSLLEALGVPFTGCNPRGLILSRNKFWTTQIAAAVGVPTPQTDLVSKQSPGKKMSFPMFIKFNREHASMAITRKNRVLNLQQAKQTVKRMRQRLPAEVLSQEFIAGDEVSVSVIGNRRLTVFPPRRLALPSHDSVATERVKFSAKHRRKNGIRALPYSGRIGRDLQQASRRLFQALDLSGYVRFDFRVNDKGYFLIDVNANPNLAHDEDLARAASADGIPYHRLLEEVMMLAKGYRPRI